MDSKLDQLYHARQDSVKSSHDCFKEKSKSRLKKILVKKFNTSFIFPIAEFEEHFGKELWGMDLQEEQLTEQQKENRKKWEQVRKNILDKGNAQARASLSEIELYEIKFKGYNLKLGGKNG